MGKTQRASAEQPKKPSVIARVKKAVDKKALDRMPPDFRKMHEKPKKKG